MTKLLFYLESINNLLVWVINYNNNVNKEDKFNLNIKLYKIEYYCYKNKK